MRSTNLKAPTGLFTLPRELRDQIYEHVFDVDVTIIKPKTKTEWLDRPTSTERNGDLTLVNKQVHRETIDMYYAKTHFICYSYKTLLKWWSCSPTFRSQLKRVTLVCVMEEEV